MDKITPEQWRQLDHQTTGQQFGAFVGTFILIGGMWFGAIMVWSLATGLSTTGFLIAAVAVGGVIGFISSAAIAFHTSRTQTKSLRMGAMLMF